MARVMPVARLAWMAGVIETRGKIRRVENLGRKSIQLILQVQTRHIHIVNRLCAMTGVEPRFTEAKTFTPGDRRGCVEHCPEPHVHMAGQMPATGVWAITGAGAAIVLHNVAPYLHSETNLAVVGDVLAALPIPADWTKPGRGAHQIWQTVNRLRTLGYVLPEPLVRTPRQWIAVG